MSNTVNPVVFTKEDDDDGFVDLSPKYGEDDPKDSPAPESANDSPAEKTQSRSPEKDSGHSGSITGKPFQSPPIPSP